MIEQIKTGDKLTVIKVNSLASTSINEITIDSIQDGRAIFAAKRKKYYLTIDNGILVLKGHKLGITQGSWNNGGRCFIMSGNCNLGGLDRESMIALLKTNINPQFNQWNNIYWFDGFSDKGDPIFVPRSVSKNYLLYQEQAEQNKNKTAGQINVGDFIYSYQKGSKLVDLTDMLKYHLTINKDFSKCLQLGKVVDIIEMDEEAFDSLKYLNGNNLLKDKGGNFSEDIAEERDIDDLSKFEKDTFYTHFTLIRTPSGRAITVDAQGYDYLRYTGLLPHYETSMATDCAMAQEALRIEHEKEQKEEQARVDEAIQQEQAEKIRVERSERCKRASTLVNQRTRKKDYSSVTDPKTTPNPAAENISAQGLKIIDYSEKAFVVIGDTKPIKETLADLGGRFNSHLKCGAGWVFPKTKMDTVQQKLSIV